MPPRSRQQRLAALKDDPIPPRLTVYMLATSARTEKGNTLIRKLVPSRLRRIARERQGELCVGLPAATVPEWEATHAYPVFPALGPLAPGISHREPYRMQCRPPAVGPPLPFCPSHRFANY